MTRTIHWLCSLALLATVGGAMVGLPKAAFADEKPAAPAPLPAPNAEGWRSLFDGKSLKPWEPVNFGGEGDVLVKDGLLVLEAGEPITGLTWRGAPLPKSNYEVRLEAQRIEGGDFFLALTFPVQESSCSLVLGGWGGGVIGLSSINGFDASENETTNYQVFESKKWYKVRVRVTDDAVQAWIDDERIVNVPTEENRFSVRIEVDANRPLGMSTYQTTAAYRRIELRELPPASKKEAATPGK